MTQNEIDTIKKSKKMILKLNIYNTIKNKDNKRNLIKLTNDKNSLISIY